MSQTQPVEKNFLIDGLTQQAYNHPKFAKLRFPGVMTCPSCTSEIAHVLTETGDRRVLWCANCGTTYKEKDMVA